MGETIEFTFKSEENDNLIKLAIEYFSANSDLLTEDIKYPNGAKMSQEYASRCLVAYYCIYWLLPGLVTNQMIRVFNGNPLEGSYIGMTVCEQSPGAVQLVKDVHKLIASHEKEST